MNILQRFAEAVFFFNPGMLWISSLIRQEREACCDDIVVANTHYKGSYLEALVSFQEYSLSTTGYAMAIGTKRHYLLNRVKRMLTRENKKLNLMEKILLLAGLVIFTAFSFIPRKEVIAQQPVRQASKRSEEVKPIEPVKPSAAPTNINLTRKPAPARKPVTSKEVAEGQDQISVSIDSVPPVAKEKPATEELSIKSASTNINDDGKTKTADITVVDQEGKTYKITKLNDKVTSLAIDGRSIPQNEISNYSSTIDRIDRALEKNRAEKEKNRQIRQAEAEKRREENKERQAEARERKEDSRKRQEEARERTEESRQRTAEQRKEKERSEKDRDKREDTDKKLKETQKRVEVQRTTIERKKKELEKDQKEINKKGKFLLNEREVVDNNHNLDFKVQSDILLKNEANINLDKKIALQSNNNHDVNLKLANSLHTESILTKKLILNNNVNIDAKSEHKFNLQLKINVDSTHKRIKSAKPCKEAPTKIVEPVTKQRNSSEPSVPPARKPVKPRYSIEV